MIVAFIYARKLARLLTVAAAASTLLAATQSFAQLTPGSLDTSFGSSGRIDAKLVAGATDAGVAVAVQADRKIVIANDCLTSSTNSAQLFCVARFNADGSADTGFAAGGKYLSALPGTSFSNSRAVAVQADGKIVVAGHCLNATTSFYDFCSTRLTAIGTLDGSWGGSGVVLTPPAGFATYAYAGSVLLQSDGKVIVTGTCGGGTFCAVRYTVTGAVDTTFGSSGYATSAGLGYAGGGKAALYSDGRFVVVGGCGVSNTATDMCVVRFSANGVRDTAYVNVAGLPGIAIGAAAHSEGANAAAIQPDNKVVLAGYCTAGQPLLSMCAMRLNENGTLDTTFNGTGYRLIVPAPGLTQGLNAQGVSIDRDGKITLAGGCDLDFCAARLHSDGAFDTAYGIAGLMRTNYGYAVDVYGASADKDGNQLIVGGCYGNDGAGIPDMCAVHVLRGSLIPAQTCTLDVDGDGIAMTFTDVLLLLRVSLGFTGDDVTRGTTLFPGARRFVWPAIRDYLVKQCGMVLSPL